MTGRNKREHNELSRVQIPAAVHLTRLGYNYIKKKELSTKIDKDTNILVDRFKSSFFRLNPEASELEFENLLKNIHIELNQNDLGRSFFERLQGKKEHKIIDWDNFDNNLFEFGIEVACENGDESFRPDITIFINGLPLSFIEVKQPEASRDKTTGIQSEFKRMEKRFENAKFRRFINITQLITFSDNDDYAENNTVPMKGCYYSSTGLKKTKFNAFKEEDFASCRASVGKLDPDKEYQILEDQNRIMYLNSPEYKVNKSSDTIANQFFTSIYKRDRLHFFLRYGIVYVNEAGKDGSVQIQKHVMRYPQYFATQAIKDMIENGGKKGVVWHTQGSGKTALTYFNNAVLRDYFSKKEIVARFYFIVDRLDLATQAKDEFVKRGLSVKLINYRSELSKPFSEDIAVVNIQKFDMETDFTDKSGYDVSIQNIYFIDEAHRSYNMKGSFLPNLYQSDPNAIKIALTGTPLITYKKGKEGEKEDRQTTRDIFGDYIHKYYYNQSIADGYTLRLLREPITTEYRERMKEALDSLEDQVQKGILDKRKLFSHPNYVNPMLAYIIDDFKKSRIALGEESIGAMVVSDSSEQARELFKQFQTDYPELKGALILSDENDKETRKDQVKEFKNGQLDILFVYNMLLTGFDAPRLKKLYLARKVKAHNLLQTLTRVNRPYKNFSVGYVVDFADISQEFEKTNQFPGISKVTIRPRPAAANIALPSCSRIRLISAFLPRLPAGISISSNGISFGKRR